MKTTSLVAACLALAASPVWAAVQFDFTGATASGTGSRTFVGNDLASEVVIRGFSGITAGADAPFASLTSARIDQYAGEGLAVQFTSENDVHADLPLRCRPDARSSWDQIAQSIADAPRGAELLQLDFSANGPVALKEVVFAGVQDGFDEFDFAIDGVDIDVNGLFGFSDPENSWNNGSIAVHGVAESNGMYRVVFPAGLPKGQVFSFYLDDMNDQYRIASVTVEPAFAAAVAHNPEPTTALVWTLLGVLGTVQRRRG